MSELAGFAAPSAGTGMPWPGMDYEGGHRIWGWAADSMPWLLSEPAAAFERMFFRSYTCRSGSNFFTACAKQGEENTDPVCSFFAGGIRHKPVGLKERMKMDAKKVESELYSGGIPDCTDYAGSVRADDADGNCAARGDRRRKRGSGGAVRGKGILFISGHGGDIG